MLMMMDMDMHVSDFVQYWHADLLVRIDCEAEIPTVASCGSSCSCATLAYVIATVDLKNEATAGCSGYVSMVVVIGLRQSGRQRVC
jgi:hypothetical protein